MKTLDYQSPGKERSRRSLPARYILIACAVIALPFLVELCMPCYGSWPAKLPAAQSDVASIDTALEAFKRNVGRYPTASEGLDALVNPPPAATGWKGPYLDKLKNDPWGHPYIYRLTANGDMEVLSCGPDGLPGTADDVR